MPVKTVEEVRRDMPVLSKSVFLNAGSLCPTPLPVMEAYFASYRQWHEQGAGHPRNYEAMRDEVTAVVRNKLAALFKCLPGEIALTSNATEGINIVAWGLDWQPGDEVIITDAEHPANSIVWMHNQERFGIKLRFLSAYKEPDTLLERLQQMLTARTKLVAVSHVLSATGRILPVKEITELAHANGSLVLLDGAHAAGQMQVDLMDIGCDFYSTNGHKWLFGPAGTGVLFVRRQHLDRVRPAFVGDIGGKTLIYKENGSYTPPPDARRYEYATRNWPLYQALGVAVDYVTAIGIDNIRGRVGTLASEFKKQLMRMPGIDMWSPLDPENSAGLVCFGLRGHDAREISTHLEAKGILARHVTDDLLRVSIGYFTLEAELQTMVEALWDYLEHSSRPAKQNSTQ
jgi:selenocysteine lyase/cysteine desulfurase